MPAKKEPQKPKPLIKAGPNAAYELKKLQDEARKQAVLDRKDEILELFSSGYGFDSIVKMLGMNESAKYVRHVIMYFEREDYVEAVKARAHSLIEEAVDTARLGKAIGDAAGLRVAVDTFIKVASKISPEYSDKATLELTGKDGGPIQADMTVSPAEAYERLIKGG